MELLDIRIPHWRNLQQQTRRCWKSSAFAVLFHGLDEEMRNSVTESESVIEMQKLAEDIVVSLRTDGGSSLLRS